MAAALDTQSLRAHLAKLTVSFGIPSYNEGELILGTLQSLWRGMCLLDLRSAPVILSDSSSTPATVDAARRWAASCGAVLVIDRSEQQRAKKAALNVVFDNATSDLLICMDADVIVPERSVVSMLSYLLADRRPEVVIGSATPDPALRGLRYRAAAWAMRASNRYARTLPAGDVRVCGNFWGAWRSFYATYRYPVGQGSMYDDVELARTLMERGAVVQNDMDAPVLRVPTGSLRDFGAGHQRESGAMRGMRRHRSPLRAALREAVADPLGFALWSASMLHWKLASPRRTPAPTSEAWEPHASTRRRTS